MSSLMRISVTDANAQLSDLVRRAESGEEVVLTRDGQAAVRLVPIRPATDRAARRTLLDSLRASGRLHATTDATAARSQDELYDESGLPG